MSQPFPKSDLRSLATKLIVCESSSNIGTAGENLPLENVPVVFRVTETLRGSLSRLVGIAGYRVLLARALSVAKSQDSTFGNFRVSQEARLEAVNGSQSHPLQDDAGVVLIAQLLGLLVTFIGEPLTISLIAEAWPSFTATNSSTLEKLKNEPRR